MKKVNIFLAFLMFLASSYVYASFQNVGGIEDSCIKRVAVSAFDSRLICVASKNALFKSQDGAKTFKKILVFKDEEVIHIFFDRQLANTLYLATTRHLYKVSDRTEQIFSCPDEEIILTAAQRNGEIFIGTSSGLYIGAEDILKWEKLNGLGDGVGVNSIQPAQGQVYLATNRGVYLFKSKDKIERALVIREKATEGEEESGINANIIKNDIFDTNTVWLGTSKGIFVSKDEGRHWEKLYIEAIDNLFVNCIAQTVLEKDTVYLGTAKGFFKVDVKNKKAKEIFEGIYGGEIFWVEFSPKGEIYLATSKGLFKEEYFTAPSLSKSIENILEEEPAIEDVQQAALRYNEVHPDKIKEWRRMLKVRALMPTVNWSYDKTIYGSSTGQFAVGPRDWGLSFGWDMGNLLWNSYEDDVDTRSRLNTQLRLDILDEINRVYFERLRLKRELLVLSLGEEELFQKKLRLKELTAILDGYTGGYYSKQTEELLER
jgi:hypothetical protein